MTPCATTCRNAVACNFLDNFSIALCHVERLQYRCNAFHLPYSKLSCLCFCLIESCSLWRNLIKRGSRGILWYFFLWVNQCLGLGCQYSSRACPLCCLFTREIMGKSTTLCRKKNKTVFMVTDDSALAGGDNGLGRLERHPTSIGHLSLLFYFLLSIYVRPFADKISSCSMLPTSKAWSKGASFSHMKR